MPRDPRRIPNDILAREQDDPARARRRARLDGDPRAQVIALRDPFDAPIPQAEEFTLNSGAVASAAAGTLSPAGLQLALSSGQLARISTITIYITDLVPTTDITWTLLVGGAPIHPGLKFFPRAATAAADSYDVYKRIRKGGAISMNITQVDAGVYTVGAIITGWFFAAKDAERYVLGGGD